MDRSKLSRFPAALLGVCAFALVPLALAPAQEVPTAPVRPLAEQVARKRHQLETVVVELSNRDVATLSTEQRAARTKALALLEEYAAREQFTRRILGVGGLDGTTGAIPEFIDAKGTRCALAAVLEGFGRDDLVTRLARECNDAYLAEIVADQELLGAIAALGLTLDEAAFIQGPGTVERDGNRIRDDNDRDGRNGSVNQTNDDIASRNAPGNSNGGGSATGMPTPTAGTPGVRGGGGAITRRSGKGAAAATTWEDWWRYQRDLFAGVRARYHDHLNFTPSSTAPTTPRPRRPSDAEITADLVPLFERVYRTSDDANVEATALAMWARSVDTAGKPAVTQEILKFLSDPHQPDRFWGLMAFAILADPSAAVPLTELVVDSPAGRKLLAQTGPVNESWRALAALALARSVATGDAAATFERVLEGDVEAGAELEGACVVALGVVGQRQLGRAGVVAALLRVLADERLPAAVRAQAPLALATVGDAAAFPTLFDIVAKFRGPREVRHSSALAVGRLAPGLDEPVVQALLALARRDTDSECRHAAIIALGELAHRAPDLADPQASAAVGLLADFHHDALLGRFRQDGDLPWHALSAAIFARRVDAVAARTEGELLALVRGAGDVGSRAAATLALGLLGRAQAAEPLRTLLQDGVEESVAAWAAEALGLLEDQNARGALLELCMTSPSEEVRYHAALGLGYLADPTVLAPLTSVFERTNSASVRAGLARALGEIGDEAAIAPLAALAGDDRRDSDTRQRALGALGVLGQREDAAWNLVFKRGANAAVAAPALRTVLSSF